MRPSSARALLTRTPDICRPLSPGRDFMCTTDCSTASIVKELSSKRRASQKNGIRCVSRRQRAPAGTPIGPRTTPPRSIACAASRVSCLVGSTSGQRHLEEWYIFLRRFRGRFSLLLPQRLPRRSLRRACQGRARPSGAGRARGRADRSLQPEHQQLARLAPTCPQCKLFLDHVSNFR
jgi:hypothetical protein